jgi:regulator of protease activity HflC (stomatin/prohibitin superfamily)
MDILIGFLKFVVFPIVCLLLIPAFLWWIGFIKVTIVEEGTARAFMRFGAFRRIVGKWRGHIIDANGNVRKVATGETDQSSWLGGLFFVGFWPLDSVYTYYFEYDRFEMVEGKLKPSTRTLTAIDYIPIRADTFIVQIKRANTKPPERMPVDIVFNVSLRVENPEKALFKAPKNWWRKLEARLISLFRGWATSVDIDEILGLKGHPKQVWDILNQESPDLISSIRSEWGIIIEKNKVEISDVSFPDDVQKALKMRKQMELEAEANLRKQEVDAKATASATLGRLMESLSQGSGVDVSVLQKELRTAIAEPDLKERMKKVRAFWSTYDPDGRIWNLIQNERLGANMILVGTPGGKPADPLTALLATFMALKDGISGGNSFSTGGNRSRKKRIEDMDDDELEEEAERDD